MPLCYGENWINQVLFTLNRSCKLPPGLVESHIIPFLNPFVGVVMALGCDTIAMVDSVSGDDIWQKRLAPCFSPLPSSLLHVAPNGMMIFVPFLGAMGSSKCAMLDASDGQEIWTRDFWMPGAAFSPSSQMLVGTGGKVLMMHAQSGKELWERTDLQASTAVFAPNGEKVAVDADGTNIAMLDVHSGEELWNYGPIAMVNDMLFALNGETLIVSAFEKIVALDASSGTELWQMEAEDEDSLLVDSDDKHIIVGSLDEVIQVDVESGQRCSRASLSAPGKSRKQVNMRMSTSDAAIATRDSEIIVLDKKSWNIANLVTSSSDDLIVASGENLAVVLKEQSKQSVAMMTSRGERLWTWQAGFDDVFVRSMAFVVPNKTTDSQHLQTQSAFCCGQAKSSDMNVNDLDKPTCLDGAVSEDDACRGVVERPSFKSRVAALPALNVFCCRRKRSSQH
mmetsp:Transcript_11094/g.20770  ORF Transcript_11094/g.20770 Transcript_11094/m.20770 type:complete len:451 (-) Transcript_11094:251-1603(-)